MTSGLASWVCDLCAYIHSHKVTGSLKNQGLGPRCICSEVSCSSSTLADHRNPAVTGNKHFKQSPTGSTLTSLTPDTLAVIISSRKHDSIEGSFPSGSSVLPSPGDIEDPFPALRSPWECSRPQKKKYVYLNVCPALSGCLTSKTWCEEGDFRLGGEGVPHDE